MKHLKFGIILSIVSVSQISLAFKFTPEICLEYGLGKNWYCEAEQESSKKDNSTITAHDIMESHLPAETKAEQLNQLWELQRKRAVITGNKKEIKSFLETHYLIASKGVGFAQNVQSLIDSDPTLASSESYYKNVNDAEIKRQEKLRVLNEAGNRYGLVFIYNSNCPYCAKQVPIIQQFKQLYHIRVMGITSSYEYFAGLDENITDLDIANDPLVKAYPTILFLDKKHPKKIFIAKGLTTFDDLESKIVNRIIEREKEDE